jgi:DNA-binding PadR family transcriptional regulator
MNDAEKAELEAKLKKVAPLMAKLSGPSILPERVKAALNQTLDKKYPLIRELTEKQMEVLLLKLIAEQPADGFELINNLAKANVKLKNGTEGLIYGILGRMENQGLVEGRWMEGSAAMKKSYYLTDHGTKLLARESALAPNLQGLINLALGRS